jgi:uncharacterized protein (TIGR03435 family)
MLAPVLLAAAYGQTSGKAEFEVASIRTNAPQAGFHFAADAASGGPGTADPAMFRCSKCTLATLIVKAFHLQPYQLPNRTSLADSTYDIQAKIPAGATEDEFSAMLQNLLKDRFGLSWHFQEKKMKGYHLIVAKNGPKLSETTGTSVPPAADQHRYGQSESHNHSGVMVFGASAMFRAGSQTTADLARILSDQIGLPVDDETALHGRYDISLRWSGAVGAHAGAHSDGAFAGDGHAGHDDTAADPSGPTIFDAVQQQLGLRLAPAEEAIAHLFIIDRIAQHPTEN